MEISAENLKKVIEQIASKCSTRTCPMCGSIDWEVGNRVFELREFNHGNLNLGGQNSAIIPIIPLTCNKCGNTHLLNAIRYEVVNNE
jgi:hypothetical protein